MNAALWLLAFLVEASLSLELCEYWTLQNKLHEHPECVEVIPVHAAAPVEEIPNLSDLVVPSRRAYRPARKQDLKDQHPMSGACSSKEVWACRDCESTCNNQAPLCDRSQCLKGCVCRMGLVRDNRNQCVSQRDCRVHRKSSKNPGAALFSPPASDSSAQSFNQAVLTKIRSWLPMVNDVWKELTSRSLF